MATAPTYDYEAENAALQRQMRLAEAMLGSGLQPLGPTQMVGGVAVKQSPMEGIAKLVQAYAGRKGIEAVDERTRNLAQRYGADLKTGVAKLIDGLSAQPGQPGPAEWYDGTPGPALDAAAAARAKREAILNAIASNHPVLSQLGMSQLQSLQKQGMTEKDWLSLADKFDPVSVTEAARTGDMSRLRPKRTTTVVNNQIVDTSSPAPQVIGDFRDKDAWGPVEKLADGPKGPIYGQRHKLTGEIKYAPGSTNVTATASSNPLVQGTNAGIGEWAKLAAKTVDELASAARAAEKMETSLNTMEALMKGGVNSGPLANAATFVQGLAKQLGVPVDKAKLANSETFNSEATQMWATWMQSLGGARGLVKEESERLAAALPSLLQSPEGRQQIITRLRQAAAIDRRNGPLAAKQYARALQSGNLEEFTFGLGSTQLPQTPGQPAAPGVASPKKPSVSRW